MALTDLSVVDMVEHLSDIVEKSTNNCLSIGAIPIVDFGGKPSNNMILLIISIMVVNPHDSSRILLT